MSSAILTGSRRTSAGVEEESSRVILSRASGKLMSLKSIVWAGVAGPVPDGTAAGEGGAVSRHATDAARRATAVMSLKTNPLLAPKAVYPKGVERVEHFLGSGEEVVLSSRQHPVVLLRALAVWLATVAALTVIGIFVLARSDSEPAERFIGGVVMAATVYLILSALRWWARRYVVTEERVLLVEGLLSVKVSSVPLSKVNDITFSRSLWGRIFGFGDIFVESAAERGGFSGLVCLPRPKEVYRVLTNLLAERDRIERPVAQPQVWPGIKVMSADDTGPLPRLG